MEADSRPEGLAEDGVTAALSTGAVARRLGVAPTTLRSWERRYAIGPATREDGRHRRWTPEDIALLEEMCRLTAQGVPPAEAARAAMSVSATVPRRGQSGETGRPGREAASPTRAPGGPNALPLGDVRQECRGLARAAVRLDAPAVDALLDAVIAEHGLVTAWEDVIAPTLHAVGRKWATSGERYIEVEHLLSWHVSSALRRVRPARVRPARVRERGRERADVPPVVLACVPGEQHSLPIEALAAALCERGVPARMFGAALPADALHEAVRRLGPAAVVLWAQSRSTADRSLVRIVSGVHWGVKGARKRTSLLLAGPGWAGGAYPGTVRLHGLGSAVDVIMALPRG